MSLRMMGEGTAEMPIKQLEGLMFIRIVAGCRLGCFSAV